MELFYEIFGYVASVIVAISLMMNSLIKLRWYNLVGSMTFSIYGFLIGAYPVAILNGFIACANIFYLIKIYNGKDDFKLLDVDHNSEYNHQFFAFYKKDISKFFPEFSYNKDLEGVYILRNMVPAGVILGKKVEDNAFEIKIDYAVPLFRDHKLGLFIYQDSLSHFKDKGFTKLIVKSSNLHFEKYITKMGFKKNSDCFELVIQ
jgi:hypothetical protein